MSSLRQKPEIRFSVKRKKKHKKYNIKVAVLFLCLKSSVAEIEVDCSEGYLMRRLMK